MLKEDETKVLSTKSIDHEKKNRLIELCQCGKLRIKRSWHRLRMLANWFNKLCDAIFILIIARI